MWRPDMIENPRRSHSIDKISHSDKVPGIVGMIPVHGGFRYLLRKTLQWKTAQSLLSQYHQSLFHKPCCDCAVIHHIYSYGNLHPNGKIPWSLQHKAIQYCLFDYPSQILEIRLRLHLPKSTARRHQFGRAQSNKDQKNMYLEF